MSQNLAAIGRTILAAFVAGLSALAYFKLTADSLAAAASAIGTLTGIAAVGIALALALGAAARFLFRAIDRILDWIHPQLVGPWFRWPACAILAVNTACAVSVAFLLNTSLAHWIEGRIHRAIGGTAGRIDADAGLLARTLEWTRRSVLECVEPYFGISVQLEAMTWGVFDHWAQPLAIAAGLATWYLGIADEAKRIRKVDALACPKNAVPIRRTAIGITPRGKRIILMCDGTSNTPSQQDNGVVAPSNVHRLRLMVETRDWSGHEQVTIYDEGVGTETSRQARRAKLAAASAKAVGAGKVASFANLLLKIRTMWEAATGAGLMENVEQGYREIARLYEPGDEIWLFGFSRGAYTARCIAGVIYRCGLLQADKVRFAGDVMTLYARRPAKPSARWRHLTGDEERWLVRKDLIHDEVAIRFMGLWDTVASLGLPLWGWWFRVGALWQNQHLNNNPAALCHRVCHALAIDETRSQFMPTLSPPDENRREQVFPQRIEQVWFRGGHAEVGGGYAQHELADVALRWMATRAAEEGLVIDRSRLPTIDTWRLPLRPIQPAVLRNRAWSVFGTWPRWHPAERRSEPDPTVTRRYGELDVSVWDRSSFVLATIDRSGSCCVIGRRAALDGLLHLDVGQSARVAITANRIWNRTGIVLERGGRYELKIAGGLWRDRECPPGTGIGDDLRGVEAPRRLLAWAKRLPSARYMSLVGHVAHPRQWPTFEFGVFKLLLFLLLRDPKPLREALLDLGTALRTSSGSVTIDMAAPAGIFYAFANDLWATYANNSGNLEIEIRRVAPDAAIPDFRITERGQVVSRLVETDPHLSAQESWDRTET
ncbi:MAG: DUF2235 domain-containing protein [Alphaproteobacteria bacterium]|nr:DUF2235 domain-containing protein [Alphaproteobacteria bacterium]